MGFLERMAQKSVAKHGLIALSKISSGFDPARAALNNTLVKVRERGIDVSDPEGVEIFFNMAREADAIADQISLLATQCSAILEGYDAYSNDLRNDIMILQGKAISFLRDFRTVMNS